MITRPHIWRALRLVKSFDLNCLHNHFKKSSREREGFTDGFTITERHPHSLSLSLCLSLVTTFVRLSLSLGVYMLLLQVIHMYS